VSIDGLPVGAAPQEVKLPAGRYRFEASFGGRRGAPKTVTVDGKGAVELDEAIEGAVYVDDGPCLAATGQRADRLAALVRLGSLLDAQQLVAVRFEEPAGGERYLIASVVDARTGEEAREARVKVRNGELASGAVLGLAKFLSTGQATAPVEAVSRAAAPAKPDVRVAAQGPPPAKASLRTAAYVTGGAGVVAALASGYFFLSASGAQARVASLCRTGSCPEGSRAEVSKLVPQAASQGTAGAVFAGVAAAALATGVVLYVLEPERSEAPSAALTLFPTGASVAVTF
jgi:hypothetical protein